MIVCPDCAAAEAGAVSGGCAALGHHPLCALAELMDVAACLPLDIHLLVDTGERVKIEGW